MFPCRIDDHIEMRVMQDSDANALFDLISHNRDHLDVWMRWSSMVQTLDDARSVIQAWADKYEAGNGFHVGVYIDGKLAGGIACRFINRESSKTEIGYWLVPEQVGKGIVSRACTLVIDHLFNVEKLHRIELQAVAGNVKSRAVAERLGFKLEGILRESEWFIGRFHDHALYSLLDREWTTSP